MSAAVWAPIVVFGGMYLVACYFMALVAWLVALDDASYRTSMETTWPEDARVAEQARSYRWLARQRFIAMLLAPISQPIRLWLCVRRMLGETRRLMR